MRKINLHQHYQEILSAVALQLVKAKIELAEDGNTITLYFGSKYVGIFLVEDTWVAGSSFRNLLVVDLMN